MFLDHIEQAKLITNQTSPTGEHGAHIVKILGCVTTHFPLCLVCEMPQRGDLLSFLQDQRILVVREATSRNIEVGPDMLLSFIEECISGMVRLTFTGYIIANSFNGLKCVLYRPITHTLVCYALHVYQ